MAYSKAFKNFNVWPKTLTALRLRIFPATQPSPLGKGTDAKAEDNNPQRFVVQFEENIRGSLVIPFQLRKTTTCYTLAPPRLCVA